MKSKAEAYAIIRERDEAITQAYLEMQSMKRKDLSQSNREYHRKNYQYWIEESGRLAHKLIED